MLTWGLRSLACEGGHGQCSVTRMTQIVMQWCPPGRGVGVAMAPPNLAGREIRAPSGLGDGSRHCDYDVRWERGGQICCPPRLLGGRSGHPLAFGFRCGRHVAVGGGAHGKLGAQQEGPTIGGSDWWQDLMGDIGDGDRPPRGGATAKVRTSGPRLVESSRMGASAGFAFSGLSCHLG